MTKRRSIVYVIVIVVVEIIAAVAFFATSMARAQPPDIIDPTHADLRTMNQEGKLFSVKIVPKEPLHILVAGKEEAQLNPKDLSLTVTRLKPGPQKIMKTTGGENGNFTVVDEDEKEGPKEIQVTTKARGKSETFHFTIENKPH